VSDPRADDRAIRDLVARYCHAIGEADDAAFADTWSPDGEWLVLGAHLRGRDAILAHYQKLVAGVRFVVQFAHDGIVELDGDRANGRWQIHELLQWKTGAGGRNIGRYRDRYVRCADGRWRFALREFSCVYLGPPDGSAGPPPSATWRNPP
jgi:ketosteroid isomerase-like protein